MMRRIGGCEKRCSGRPPRNEFTRPDASLLYARNLGLARRDKASKWWSPSSFERLQANLIGPSAGV